MKQDVDLLRKILLKIEDETGIDDDEEINSDDFAIPGYSGDQIVYHLLLLKDADYIVAEKEQYISDSKPHVNISRLTKEGHDFLNLARDDNRWATAIKSALANAGAATIQTVIPILVQMAAKHLPNQ